jgi:hypothetical protein
LYPQQNPVAHNNKHQPLQRSQPPGFRSNGAGVSTLRPF